MALEILENNENGYHPLVKFGAWRVAVANPCDVWVEGKVTFMMVNLTDGESETVESARNFIHMMEYTFPVYYDTDMDASTVYGIQSIPTTFFIDAEGNLIAYGEGALDGETLKRGISMIYAEEK